ncbi:MAG: hypothetical protein ACXWR1_12485 [Bdellovibrionota bacterium]
MDCCGLGYVARFDHDDAPALPKHRFRTNVSCPGCSKIVILTLTVHPQGTREVGQEVIPD